MAGTPGRRRAHAPRPASNFQRAAPQPGGHRRARGRLWVPRPLAGRLLDPGSSRPTTSTRPRPGIVRPCRRASPVPQPPEPAGPGRTQAPGLIPGEVAPSFPPPSSPAPALGIPRHARRPSSPSSGCTRPRLLHSPRLASCARPGARVGGDRRGGWGRGGAHTLLP